MIQIEKGQSKLASFLEANVNTIIGFLITLVVSPIAYDLVGMEWTFNQLWQITFIFTIISVIRGYLIRRFFNLGEKKKEDILQRSIQFWKDLNYDLLVMNEGEKIQALKLIHGYKKELELCKSQYQHFVADIAENTNYLELIENGQSNKRNIEDEK